MSNRPDRHDDQIASEVDVWTVYIVECRDGRLYTGITNNLEKRLAAHNDGTGARFTRGRGPVILRYHERQPDRSTASKSEMQIKKLSRSAKLRLTNLKHL